MRRQANVGSWLHVSRPCAAGSICTIACAGVSLANPPERFLLFRRQHDRPSKPWSHLAVGDVLRVERIDQRRRQSNADQDGSAGQRKQHAGAATGAQRTPLQALAAQFAAIGPHGTRYTSPRQTASQGRTPAARVSSRPRKATLAAAASPAAIARAGPVRATDRATEKSWRPARCARTPQTHTARPPLPLRPCRWRHTMPRPRPRSRPRSRGATALSSGVCAARRQRSQRHRSARKGRRRAG